MNGQQEKAYEAFIKTEKLSEIYQKNKTLGTSLAALKCILAISDLCMPNVIRPLSNLNESEFNEIKDLYKNNIDFVM